MNFSSLNKKIIPLETLEKINERLQNGEQKKKILDELRVDKATLNKQLEAHGFPVKRRKQGAVNVAEENKEKIFNDLIENSQNNDNKIKNLYKFFIYKSNEDNIHSSSFSNQDDEITYSKNVFN